MSLNFAFCAGEIFSPRFRDEVGQKTIIEWHSHAILRSNETGHSQEKKKNIRVPIFYDFLLEFSQVLRLATGDVLTRSRYNKTALFMQEKPSLLMMAYPQNSYRILTQKARKKQTLSM